VLAGCAFVAAEWVECLRRRRINKRARQISALLHTQLGWLARDPFKLDGHDSPDSSLRCQRRSSALRCVHLGPSVHLPERDFGFRLDPATACRHRGRRRNMAHAGCEHALLEGFPSRRALRVGTSFTRAYSATVRYRRRNGSTASS
jgi:hypothetical protein